MKGIGNTIKKHHKAIGLGMAAAGGAILAAGALSIKTFAEMGDEVQKMALRTGFSTEALSELRHAAELSGTQLGSLEKASKTLSGAILDAGFGLETYVRAFDKIGLSYEDLKRLSPEDQFLAVMEALAGLTDESEKAALAADIFGRAGTQLLPMLANGTEGLSEMRQEAHDLGVVFDQEAANKAAEFNDAMQRMGESVSGVKMVIAGELIPVLMPLIEKVKEVISGISAWMKEHPRLTKVIIIGTTALGILLVVLGGLLITLPLISSGFHILTGALLSAKAAVWGLKIAAWEIVIILTSLAAVVLMVASAIRVKGIPTYKDYADTIKATVGWLFSLTSGLFDVNAMLNQHQDAIAVARREVDGIREATKLYTEEEVKAAIATGWVITRTKELESSAGSLKGKVDKLTASVEGLSGAYRQLQSFTGRGLFAGAVAGLEERKGRPLRTGEISHLYETLYDPESVAERMGISEEQLELEQFQHGGTINEPTLLTSLRTMRPYAIAGEKGKEHVVPDGGGSRMVNIFVELDGRVIAKAIGQPLVDELRLRGVGV